MARPPRHNAEYFTHSAALRNDRRVKAIRTALGAAGYGIFHMLLDTSELEVELLAGDFGVSATEIHSLLQFAEKVGYFTRTEAGLLICPELNKWLEPVFEKRNRARNTAKPDLLPQADAVTGVSVTENPQSKVKESRVKESKEDTTSPLRSEVDAPAESSSADYSSHTTSNATTPESPSEAPASASHTRGAADVGTSIKPKKAKRTSPEESPAFAAFYEAYPRKEKPVAAAAAFARLSDADQQKAISSVKVWFARRSDWIGPNGEDYRPHPTTWLNNHRWTELDNPTPVIPLNPQRNAVFSSTYGNQNSAAARLHTPAPSAEAGWGYPGG